MEVKHYAKFIQICSDNDGLFALDTEGVVWQRQYDYWSKFDNNRAPQPEAENE